VPMARYFMVAGSALPVLLLIAGWSFAEPPASFPDRPEVIERAAIRIRSERKCRRRVVLDTNQPTIPPPSIEGSAGRAVGRAPADRRRIQTSVDSLAKLILMYGRSMLVAARGAKRRAAGHFHRLTWPELAIATSSYIGTGEECRRSEWADRSAISKAASRRCRASGLMDRLAFPGGKIEVRSLLSPSLHR